MRTIKLYGELGKKYGKIHKFMVSSPAEAIRALSANFPGFQKDMATAEERNIGFRVFNGNDELDNENRVHEIGAGHIKIVPVVIGANATARILIGSVLIVAGAVAIATGVGAGAAPYLFSAGIGMVLGGVIELLSPVPKVKTPDEKPENKPSYLFNGPVNTTAQGHPVPVGYGRVRVGGGVVSAGISVDQIMAGYRRVSKERTVDLVTFDNVTFSGVPQNWFRKELVSYIPADPLNPYSYPMWIYKFYYYEIVLELIPT